MTASNLDEDGQARPAARAAFVGAGHDLRFTGQHRVVVVRTGFSVARPVPKFIDAAIMQSGLVDRGPVGVEHRRTWLTEWR